jgi:hypothetical protein
MAKESVFESAPRSLQFAGFLILLACSGQVTENKLVGTLVGYGFIMLGVAITTTLLFQDATMKNASGISSAGPFILFISLMTTLIYLLSKHFTRIVSGHVSMSFSNMLNLKNILIMLILAIISMSSNSDEFKKTGLIGTEYKAALYCMNIVSSVILVTIYIILSIYPTDGFVSSIGFS